MDSPITRAEHEEFRRRMEEENSRQDARIKILERQVDGLKELSVSIERLAINMENMVKEQVKQGERLEVLESQDGKMWREVVKYVITTLIGLVLGFLFNQIMHL